MLFNSFQFLLFLPLIVIVYYLTVGKYRWIVLLIASYYFYASWNIFYLIIIATSTFIVWTVGREISRNSKNKSLLIVGISVPLLILFFFKYYNFFSENISLIIIYFNQGNYESKLDVILPVGISFYTFQLLSYLVDIKNEKIKSEPNLARFALYVSFFPQLVAGPIERASNLIPQLRQNFKASINQMRFGINLIIVGFFKKLVIADNISFIVNKIYDSPELYGGTVLCFGTFLFAIQIYCDFSGYSDIAIGTAKLFGINLMDNFKAPYFSSSITEFWRRWHISLSTWFKDYVYIPLGGNRRIKWRWYFNLIVTFLLSGLWHGANWTFIAWGGVHGFYLILYLQLEKTKWFNSNNFSVLFIKKVLTFTLVCFAWVFFRSNEISGAFLVFSKILNYKIFFGFNELILFLKNTQGLSIFHTTISLIMILILVAYDFFIYKGYDIINIPNGIFRLVMLSCIFILILIFGAFSRQSEFIYFQF